MSDDLEHRLQGVVERVPEGRPDLEAVIKRGKRTKMLRVTAGIVGATGLLVLVAVAAVDFGVTGSQLDQAVAPREATTGGDGADLADPRERAGTIAIAALHAARLQGAQSGFDYGETVLEGNHWIAHFCSSEAEISVCSAETSDASMRVERVLEDMYVRSADGSLDSFSTRLEGYTEPAAPPAPRFVFRLLSGSGEDGHVAFGSYWTGAIPSRLQADCRLQAFDGDGKVIYEGRPFPMDAPSKEGARDGGLGTQLPEDVDSHDLRLECTDYRIRPEPERFHPPEGEGRVLGKGTLPDDAPGNYSGLRWKVLGWDEPERWCIGVETSDNPNDPEMICVPRTNKTDEIFRGGGYTTPEPGGPILVKGLLDPKVRRVVVAYRDGSKLEGEVVRPPADMDIPAGYLVVFVPKIEEGIKIAYDADGNVLGRQPLDPGRRR